MNCSDEYCNFKTNKWNFFDILFLMHWYSHLVWLKCPNTFGGGHNGREDKQTKPNRWGRSYLVVSRSSKLFIFSEHFQTKPELHYITFSTMCVCLYIYYIYIWVCTKADYRFLCISRLPSMLLSDFNKGQRDGAMQRNRHMSMHAKSNLLQAPSETQSPAVSLLTQSASLCLGLTANQQQHTLQIQNQLILHCRDTQRPGL